jgi:hypothetical protein
VTVHVDRFFFCVSIMNECMVAVSDGASVSFASLNPPPRKEISITGLGARIRLPESAVDVYTQHPKVPGLHVHAAPYEHSMRVEGVADFDSAVIQNELHTHSPWSKGVHVPVDMTAFLVERKHTGTVFFLRNNCEFILPTPSGPDTPLQFKFVLAVEGKAVVFHLPEPTAQQDTVWSTASYVNDPKGPFECAIRRDEEMNPLEHGEILVDHGAVVVQTCSMRPPAKPAYVIQPCL